MHGRPDLRASPTVAGHPRISWSVVLDASLASELDPVPVRRRLEELWPPNGTVGPVPNPQLVGASSYEASLQDAADQAYGETAPLCRVLLTGGADPRICVAGHHAALDGLGLVAVLGAALGESLGTSARGVDLAGRRARGTDRGYLFGRVAESLLSPPTRIASEHHRRGDGDHLLRSASDGPLSSAALVSAATSAVRVWNRDRGARSGSLVVAVGASRSPGHTPRIGRQATWFRMVVGEAEPAEIRRRLSAEPPQPEQSSAMLRIGRAFGLARVLEQRTGSSFLVSSLGRLLDSGTVKGAAFFPAAHGRSGVAFGGLGVGDSATITIRARRSDFTRDGAGALLDRVVRNLQGQR